jgi:hypothetical protein
LHNGLGIASHDRSRMLWAELPTISPPNELYVFDALGGPSDATPTATLVPLHDWETHFNRTNLAISGDGSRLMHRQDVYNNSYQYVGSVAPRNIWFLPALSWRGTRAAIYNNDTDELTLYDVSTDNNFSSLGVIDTFSADSVALQLMYHPTDAALFVWGGSTAPGANYRLFVRELP